MVFFLCSLCLFCCSLVTSSEHDFNSVMRTFVIAFETTYAFFLIRTFVHVYIHWAYLVANAAFRSLASWFIYFEVYQWESIENWIDGSNWTEDTTEESFNKYWKYDYARQNSYFCPKEPTNERFYITCSIRKDKRDTCFKDTSWTQFTEPRFECYPRDDTGHAYQHDVLEISHPAW